MAYSSTATSAVGSITYNADGERTGLSDGTGTWTWQYDSLHRLTSATEGGSGTVGYQYDLRNLVTQLTYPDSHSVTRSYDALRRLTSTSDWLGNTVKYGYDANGDLTSQVDPANSLGVYDGDAFTYDSTGQMTTITVSNTTPSQPGTTLFTASYGRDHNGQVIADSSVPTNAGSYGYTPINQLCYAATSSTAPCSKPPTGSTPYSYDAADNLVQQGVSQQSFNAADEFCWTLTGVNSKKPCSTPPRGSGTYGYDVNGNRTTALSATGSATTMGYDQENRLTSWTHGTTTANYSYNADGLRMKKTINGTATAYAWDLAAAAPLLLSDGSTDYVYGPSGSPIEQISGSTVVYFHHDQLGSTRLLTDSNGLVASTYTYDPFGNLTASTGTAATPLKYAGQYQDAESGLYYLRARYYDPSTGQFLSRDRLVALTRSPYGYVNGNPLNAADPSGLVFTTEGGSSSLDFSAMSQTAQEQYAALNNLLQDIFQKQTELKYNYERLSDTGKLDHIQRIEQLIEKAWTRLNNLQKACSEAAGELRSFVQDVANFDLYTAAGLPEPAPVEEAPLDEAAPAPDAPEVPEFGPEVPIDLIP